MAEITLLIKLREFLYDNWKITGVPGTLSNSDKAELDLAFENAIVLPENAPTIHLKEGGHTNEEYTENIVYILKTARKILNMSQRTFANEMGLPRRTLENWENRGKVPLTTFKLFLFKLTHDSDIDFPGKLKDFLNGPYADQTTESKIELCDWFFIDYCILMEDLYERKQYLQ